MFSDEYNGNRTERCCYCIFVRHELCYMDNELGLIGNC